MSHRRDSDKQPASPQRRRLLKSSAGLLALSALPAAGAWGARAADTATADLNIQGLCLFNPDLAAARRFSDHLPQLLALPLEGDLVRAWRDGLADHYRQGVWLAGLGPWDEVFLLRELARETGRRPLVLEQAHARRVLDSEVGLREAALGLQRLMTGGESARPEEASGSPRLFSWAIRAA